MKLENFGQVSRTLEPGVAGEACKKFDSQIVSKWASRWPMTSTWRHARDSQLPKLYNLFKTPKLNACYAFDIKLVM